MSKPIFTLNKDNTRSTYTIAGELKVKNAKELRAFLLPALEQQAVAHVSLDKVTSIDTASLQIMYAVKKEVEQRGGKIAFSWPTNESVKDLLTKTGITKIL